MQAVIGFMHDLVHRIRRGRPVGILPVMGCQLFGDLVQPLVKLCLRPGVERGK